MREQLQFSDPFQLLYCTIYPDFMLVVGFIFLHIMCFEYSLY